MTPEQLAELESCSFELSAGSRIDQPEVCGDTAIAAVDGMPACEEHLQALANYADWLAYSEELMEQAAAYYAEHAGHEGLVP